MTDVEWTYPTDLDEIISFDGFCFAAYFAGEKDILKPQLERMGYTRIRFFTLEGDSFGPLIRGCNCVDSTGVERRFFYG